MHDVKIFPTILFTTTRGIVKPIYRSRLSHHIPTRSLHSSNTNLLSVRRVHATFASRGFSVAFPALWNSLPSGPSSS